MAHNLPLPQDLLSTLTSNAFQQKWLARFADNQFQNITEATFREFVLDLGVHFTLLKNLQQAQAEYVGTEQGSFTIRLNSLLQAAGEQRTVLVFQGLQAGLKAALSFRAQNADGTQTPVIEQCLNYTGTDADEWVELGSSNGSFAELSGIPDDNAALDNALNAAVQRQNHTGEQAIDTIIGLLAALDGKQAALGFTPENAANRNQALGYLGLDATGLIDIGRIPILPAGRRINSAGSIADLTSAQQQLIGQGSIVTTTDGFRWSYDGSGSKTAEASYIKLSDITPDWPTIANKPAFTAAATAPVSAAGLTLLAAATPAAQLTALGLDPFGEKPLLFTATKLTGIMPFRHRVEIITVLLLENVPHLRYQLRLPGQTPASRPYLTDTELTAAIAALTEAQVAAGFFVHPSAMKAVAPAPPAAGIAAGTTSGAAIIKVKFL